MHVSQLKRLHHYKSAIGIVAALMWLQGCKAPEAPEAPPTATTTPAQAPTASDEIQLEAGAVFKDCPTCPEMVIVPPGSLDMGHDGGVNEERYEGPVHPVSIGYRFAMGRLEITNTQFAQFVDATGYAAGADCRMWTGETVEHVAGKDWRDPGYGRPPTGDEPVACINWYDAKAYVEWLSEHTGQSYRLPSEVEWEYAARGSSTGAYPWGDAPEDGCPYANTYDQASAGQRPWDSIDCNDGFRKVAVVGSLTPNPFGLYDMTGNVWEWAEDCYIVPYGVQPNDGSAHQVDGTCEKRVVRGGGWHSRATWQRPTFRGRDDEDFVTQVFGMRVVRDIEQLALAPKASFKDCADCPEMVVIPPGSFRMGFDGGVSEERYEGPVRQIDIAYEFAAGLFEITNAQYAAFLDDSRHEPTQDCSVWDGEAWATAPGTSWDNPGYGRPVADDEPAVCMTWKDTKVYVTWLAQKTGQPYRLLTEAEWEYIAHDGGATTYTWGDDPDGGCGAANIYDRSGYDETRPFETVDCDDGQPMVSLVGSYPADGFGLYDVTGNVWEWVEDCYLVPAPGAPVDGSAVQVDGDCANRVVKGGAWPSHVSWQRPTFRGRDPEYRISYIFGFRIARDLR